jgi:hypothetical protein
VPNYLPRYDGNGEMQVELDASYASVLDGRQWTASHHDRFTPMQITPRTYWIGG